MQAYILFGAETKIVIIIVIISFNSATRPINTRQATERVHT